MGKNISIDLNITDYYQVYDLTRGARREELLKELRRKKNGLIQKQQTAPAEKKVDIEAKISKLIMLLDDAIAIFKNEEKFKEYNKQLDLAYANGVIDTNYQDELIASLDEVERLFYSENYGAAINLCNQLISDKGATVQLYEILAKSYYLTGNRGEALNVAEVCARDFPHDSVALDMAVRMSVRAGNDFNKAQSYMNLIIETFAGTALAALDQAYILMAQNNLDMGFSVIDDYIKLHPSDNKFRSNAAYDMIAFGNSMFKGNGSDNSIVYLDSPEEYAICKRYADKACEICNDQTVREYAEDINYYGKVEFNEDNKEHLRWSLLGCVVFIIAGLAAIGSVNDMGFSFGLGGLLCILCGIGCGFVYVNLRNVSKRQYWQINKYYMTGERLPKEQFYINIGTALTFIFKYTVKFTIEVNKFILKLLFRM